MPGRSTYTIALDGRSITCLVCGLTSFHPEDVRNLYCGNCHRFHEPASVEHVLSHVKWNRDQWLRRWFS